MNPLDWLVASFAIKKYSFFIGCGVKTNEFKLSASGTGHADFPILPALLDLS